MVCQSHPAQQIAGTVDRRRIAFSQAGEQNVLESGQMRQEQVLLKDEADGARPVGLQRVPLEEMNLDFSQQNRTFVRRFERAKNVKEG